MVDTDKGHQSLRNPDLCWLNIPSHIGGPTAYVGFTATTSWTSGGGAGAATQDILAWTYSATYIAPPPPAPPTVPTYSPGFTSVGLTLNGGAALYRNRLRLTNGYSSEARSAFFSSPVNIHNFSTDFDFQLTNANADGFTFTIQGDAPTALGLTNEGLGYATIAHSAAIKFDLHNNQGEGPDSTGLYTNGATPTVPSINLLSTGINLHSGDPFHAQLDYDGITLTVILTDTVTKTSATQTYNINIPSIIGGPTAYVGFTAATGWNGGNGGGTAVQDILDWTYTVEAGN